jgi:hypothetical protein
MSVVNPDGKRMMLACDGGGLRGIIAARCLQRLEEVEGKPCNQIFDFMAGTSTGSVIVAGLAAGVPTSTICDFYVKESRRVFQKLPWLYQLLRRFGWRYDKTYLRKRMSELIGDTRLKDLPVDILITVKDTVRSETIFLEKDTFGEMRLADAVEASGSAPTYFRPLERYIDGGVGAFNNPCYQAAREAMHYYRKKHSPEKYPDGGVRMLSFGAGRAVNAMQEGEAERKSALDWARYILDELMDDANDQQVSATFTDYHQTGRLDFRRYQVELSREGVEMLELDFPLDFDYRMLSPMDNLDAIPWWDKIGRALAERIDFADPGGLDLRPRRPLKVSDELLARLSTVPPA